MPDIEFTATIEIEDDEYDDGPRGPLTQAAFEKYHDQLQDLGFTDIQYKEVD